MIYTGKYTDHISFPLGGIGTGCVGLSGTGHLIDWEIFGRPNKESINGYTHLAVKAENAQRVLDARVLQGDLPAPYIGGRKGTGIHTGYGFGPDQMTMAGFSHFSSVEFCGEFPVATLNFADAHFPGHVKMTAFNPFIPMQADLSGIPAAFFELAVTNTTQEDLRYTLAFSLQNPTGTKAVKNRFCSENSTACMQLLCNEYAPEDYRSGNLALTCDCADTSYQEYWYRGGWSDPVETFWREFTAYGSFENRCYDDDCVLGQQILYDTATLAAHVAVPAGETRTVRFVLAWYYPNMMKSWDEKYHPERKMQELARWRQYYATQYSSAAQAALFGMHRFTELLNRTLLFKNALFSSTLTPAELDALSANLSTLKSPTVLRLEEGQFYGFEGCFEDAGCCEGSCQHVWNYAYALPFLFPELERSMRELEFRCSLDKNGRMGFRLQLPLGTPPEDFRACVDGQMGAIIKTYREWKISGDTNWLRTYWPCIKAALEYAWSDRNEDRWDINKTGVLTGRQHHTLDMELFGPNAWLQGFYLCALKAAAEMAQALSDTKKEQEYRHLFEQGKQWTDENLFNGEYYSQRITLSDKSVLASFAQQTCLHGDNTMYVYWNDEAGEIKYQIGEGCDIDQVIGQWHANNCGLGEILDAQKVNSALESIYRYNYHASMREVDNPWRLYGLNDEGGTVICTWPENRRKPAIPLTYNSETMHGFEYQAACHMIQAGLRENAQNMVASVRDKYDGYKRNPYNEFECGNNYARSMASYGLLLAESGFSYDMTLGMLGFAPRVPEQNYRFFWSVQNAFGIFEKQENMLTLAVLEGTLHLQKLVCSAFEQQEILSCTAPFFRSGANTVELDIRLTSSKELMFSLTQAF